MRDFPKWRECNRGGGCRRRIMARRRLPQWADRIWLGNAIEWVPPPGLRFDYVDLLLDCVPRRRRPDLIRPHLASTPGTTEPKWQFRGGQPAARTARCRALRARARPRRSSLPPGRCHEREGLLRERKPAPLFPRADHYPLLHRLALARVERRAFSGRDQLCHPLARKLQHQPAAPGHGEDPPADLKGAGPEATSGRAEPHTVGVFHRLGDGREPILK